VVRGFYKTASASPVAGTAGTELLIKITVPDERRLEKLNHALVFSLADIGIVSSGNADPTDLFKHNLKRNGAAA